MREYNRELWPILSRRGRNDTDLWDIALAPCRKPQNGENGCSACLKGASELVRLRGLLPPGEWQKRRALSPIVKGESVGNRQNAKRQA